VAAENFKVKKGLEVGTAITATSSGVNVTGVVTATTFVGDGSGLTGVTGSGSGVVIKHDGSAIGTASTINFSTNLDVSTISAGIVTITASNSGISNVVEDTTPQLGGNLDLDGKFINGTGGANITGVITATTFVGNGDFVNLDVDGETDLDDLSVAGVSTFTGAIDANGDLDVDGQTNLDDVSIVGVATVTNTSNSNILIETSDTTSSRLVVKNSQRAFAVETVTGGTFRIRDGSVNQERLTINSSGNVSIPNQLDVDGQTDLDDVVVAGVSTFNDGITLGTNSTTFAAKFADDAVANFGTDNDLQISHDNSNALIRNSTGKIVVVGVVSATSGANITGVVTATTFSGSGASLTNLPSGQLSGALPALDGSALTGVTASGSGVVVKHDGTTVGTAGTINFSTNLDVTAISAGIVTITASSGGSNASTFTVTANNSTDETVYPIFVDGTTGSQGAESDTNLSYNPSSNILTAGTFSGNLSGTVNTAAQTSITSLGTLSALTVSGDVTANGNIVGDNSTNISGIASVTATSFHGSGIGLTSLDADNLGSGVIPNGRFPATLPAASGANLTSLTAGNISGTIASGQIADEAVTFAKMQHVGTGVFIGRNDSGSGDIETLTAAEARTLLNVADGATAGITTASSNVTATWSITASDSNGYEFTGPGQDGSEDDPDIYLMRGHKYRFVNTTGNSHPFEFRNAANDADYTDGITGAQNGTQEFSVQHDAPAALKYRCTIHTGNMLGNIYIVGQHLANGANNRVLTATSAYGINAESNMTFDGDDLTISHTGLAVNIFESTDNHSRLRIKSSDASLTQLEFGDQSDADAGEIRYDHANDRMTFHVGNNDEKLQITSSGRIGFGEDSPSRKFSFAYTDGTNFSSSNAVYDFLLWNKANISSYPTCGASIQLRAGNTSAGGGNITGVRRGGANQGDLAFSTTDASGNPVEKLRITSGGKVGIGTNNPTDILDINSDQASAVSDVYIRNHANLGGAALNLWTQGTYTSPTYKAIIGCSDAGGTIRMGAASNHDLLLLTNNDAKITIKSTGNVGINTNNPTNIFESHALGNDSDNFQQISFERKTSANSKQAFGLVIRSNAQTSSGNEPTAYLRFDARPSSLNGSHGGNAIIAFSPIGVTQGTYGSGHLDFYVRSGGTYTFLNDPGNTGEMTPKVRIEGGHSIPTLLIGQTSSNDDANGWTLRGGINSSSCKFTSTDVRTMLDFTSYYSTGSQQSKIYFETTGKIYARTTSIQAYSSERRTKKNIVELNLEKAWNTLRDTPFYTFNFKDEIEGTALHHGPIVDECREDLILPTQKEDEVGIINTVNAEKLQYRAYSALQQALKRIEQLEAEVTALKSS